VLFEETGGMYPELVTRSDLEVFLPPIGGQTVYIFGNPRDLANPEVELTARVHDECNGSDVFGSDICTCRPYLTHAIEECIQASQRGGVGLVAYSRKEGRALGEVTKFLVYNARKRQVGGDTADQYFARTECVAGVQDMRFQELMPDVLHWLGVKKIHRLVSMSNMKYDAITGSGIEIGERVNIPDELIPPTRESRWTPRWRRLLHVRHGAGRRRTQEGQGPGVVDMASTHLGSHQTEAEEAASDLRTTTAIRERAQAVAVARPPWRIAWFVVDEAFMETAANEVVAATRSAIPSCTSRYTAAGATSRPAASIARPSSTGCSRACRRMRGHAMIDLTVVSVLLDAARDPTGNTSSRARPDLHPLRRAGRGELPCLHRRLVLQRQEPALQAIRWPARPGHRSPGLGVSGQRTQPAGGHRGARRPAAAAGRGDVRAARGVRRGRAARRPVRHDHQPLGPDAPTRPT
jgi:GTP cyclohydrolase II